MSFEKLKSLEKILKSSHIDGYIISKANAHQSEYLGSEDERLKWLTHFTGSAGFCVVLKEKVVLFVDGRYRLQAPKEVDTSVIEIVDTTHYSIASWLAKNIDKGMRIGFDPWLLTFQEMERYQKIVQEKEAFLVPLEENLIDQIWHDRPLSQSHSVVLHPINVTGLSAEDKIKSLVQKIADKDADVTLINLLESVNWLFNIRGRDLEYVPVVYAFALVERTGQSTLFVDPCKLPAEVKLYLSTVCRLESYDRLIAVIEEKARKGMTFLLDPQSTPFKIKEVIETAQGKVKTCEDLTLLPKACKTVVEIEGMRATHIRDGAALTEFLAWISTYVETGCSLNEWEASEKLHAFRKQNPTFWGESFTTISGSGPNGAIVHYRAFQDHARNVQKNDMYLIDSGGHYHDGSTDVTRTLILGTPTPEQKDRFTRVLKGHIALAKIVFPQGTTGTQIDVLARQFLWQAGLDYAHGTGHGVGSVLNIHEGPQRIAKSPGLTPLLPGMIVSNEPGYYKEDAYGIRIESLVHVVEVTIEGAEQKMLGFETLTMVPIDLNLTDKSLMTAEEVTWLNHYHTQVRQKLISLLDSETQRWLIKATEAI